MRLYFLPVVIMGLLLLACNKEIADEPAAPVVLELGKVDIVHDKASTSADRILIDASKDGGVWWFPQGKNGYDITAHHQGQKLAEYLRSQGFAVDELATGVQVTTEVLNKYARVVRVGAIKSYTPDEIAAYVAFLNSGASLLFCQDHLKNAPNDALSKHLGLEFAGAGGSDITQLAPHEITTGVSSIPYMVGSAIVNKDKSKMTILGSLGNDDYVDLNGNNIKDAADAIAAPVMGILHHPKSKIFFIGDVNGLEQIPQPFTKNLVEWLF